MLPKYISDAKEQAGSLLTDSTLSVMDSQASAGLSDDEEDASNDDDDIKDVDKDSDNGDAQLRNNVDDSDSKQQVLMQLCLFCLSLGRMF
jgi:hypothetical protein